MTGIDLNDTVEEDAEEAEPGNSCSQHSRTSSAATGTPPPPPQQQPQPGAAVCLELWHACAGPVAPLPRKGTVVVYLPQGHLEHLADAAAGGGTIPPSGVPPHVFCRVVDVTLHVRALARCWLLLQAQCLSLDCRGNEA